MRPGKIVRPGIDTRLLRKARQKASGTQYRNAVKSVPRRAVSRVISIENNSRYHPLFDVADAEGIRSPAGEQAPRSDASTGVRCPVAIHENA
jgi:hypothetical protein